MELMTVFGEFAQAAAPAAVTALWQAAVLAAGLALCLRIAPRLSAADRFRAWVAGFAAAVTLPFLPWLGAAGFGAFASVNAAAHVSAATPAARGLFHFDPRWTLLIAAVWIAASAWRLTDLALHGLWLRRLWKRATPAFSGAEALESLAAVAAQLQSCPDTKRIEVCSTRDLNRPSVIGFLRPRILIPEWLLERLTERELEQVILHEAEHLRRRDDWTNLAQKLVLAVFPLNPALWWMERRVCREREMACDEAVVRATEKPRDYAACLASLAERGLERKLARRREALAGELSLGAWRRRPELVERVQRILRRRPGLSPAAARSLLAVVGCGLVLGSVEFARCPQLVAFVAAPKVVAQSGATQDSVATPLAADGQALSGYRAVNAMARVPSRAELAAMRGTSNAARMQRHPAVATGFQKAGPPARRAVAQLAQDDSAEGIAQPNQMATARNLSRAPVAVAQQWVVLTTWEQVETIPNGPRVYQDGQPEREASTSAAPSANAGQTQTGLAQMGLAQTGTASFAGRVTITQLILRVYPAAANMPAAGQSGLVGKFSGGKFTSGMPAPRQVIPLRDGWLVLQL